MPTDILALLVIGLVIWPVMCASIIGGWIGIATLVRRSFADLRERFQ
jgi:hypothetical protein